ncbi:hypothetical protein FRC11_011967, partial [Ceratobasidium sp. 423]
DRRYKESTKNIRVWDVQGWKNVNPAIVVKHRSIPPVGFKFLPFVLLPLITITTTNPVDPERAVGMSQGLK